MNPNYTYLYNNLRPEIKKQTNIYRSLSPVVIKTFGGNNFVYERQYKTKTNNDINDPEYDYIENELKKLSGIKPHTAYTELSTQENMSLFSSQMQKPTKRYYKNRTNINPEGNYCLYSGNDNIFLKERNDNKTRTYINDNPNYKYKILKKEEINEIFYPNENSQNNSNYKNYKQKKKQTELISQSFSTSIIPEKKLVNNKNNKRNNIFEIKYIKHKKSFPNKEIELNIPNNSYSNTRRDSSFSKSKISLDEFNIDKLKEIGDNYAMRLSTNRNNITLNNSDNNYFNLNNKFKKENGIIKNMIIFEENRKSSNKKTNLLLKSNDEFKSKNKNKKLYDIDIKNKIKTPNKIDKINLNIKYNEKNKKIKIINIDKKNRENLKVDIPPNNIKIKLKHKIMGKQYDYEPNISGNKVKRILYYKNINNIYKINNNNNNYKFEKDKIYNNSPKKIKIIQKALEKKLYSPKKTTNNNYNSNKIINIKGISKKIDLNIINHSYLESINVNKNKKASKIKHSFNDIFLPSQ
jgi:hypothetical protein